MILGVTHPKRGNPALAGLAIGLTLTLIHLITIPVDNTSVNPARSIAAAIYGGADAWSQIWVFIVFPIVGALLAGPLLHRETTKRTTNRPLHGGADSLCGRSRRPMGALRGIRVGACPA